MTPAGVTTTPFPVGNRAKVAASVLVVSHQAAMWGAERQLLAVAPGLAERGIALTLAAPAGGTWLEAWRSAGLAGADFDLPDHRGLRDAEGRRASPLRLAREAAVVAASAARIGAAARAYDAVLSMSLDAHVETALGGRLACRPVAIMLVDIVHPGVGLRLLRAACRSADLTIVNSSATAATVTHGRRVELVHPSIDTHEFAPGPASPAVRRALGADDGELLVGIVGRLDEEKGVHVLLEAVRGLDVGPKVKVAVVGELGVGPASYARRLRAEARALGDRVRFAGRRQDVPEVIRACDVLVCASRAEPFGLSVLEAQACGVPVVATDAGGVPDLVEDGVSGILVPPGDPEALRAALLHLLTDAPRARGLAARARAQAVARFDVEAHLDRLAALLGGLTPATGNAP